MITNTRSREYELEITRLATHLKDAELPALWHVLEDPNGDRSARLQAYCVLFTYHRRHREIKRCIDLYEKYRADFGNEFIAQHLLSIAQRDSGKRKDLLSSIELAETALESVPRHPGVLNTLAGALLRLAQDEGTEKETSQRRLKEAREAVEEAIELESSYAKFYATKADILSALGDYENALGEITKAIDKEDRHASDYPLRITDYLTRKLKIELSRSIKTVTDESRMELADAMTEARRSNLEILSFFVAVITFLLAGINIAARFPLQNAIQLLFVLSSLMLITVSGFILLYDSRRRWTRFFQAFVVAIGILLLGIFSPDIFSRSTPASVTPHVLSKHLP